MANTMNDERDCHCFKTCVLSSDFRPSGMVLGTLGLLGKTSRFLCLLELLSSRGTLVN